MLEEHSRFCDVFGDFAGDHRVVAPGESIGAVQEVRIPCRSVVPAPAGELDEDRRVPASVVEHLPSGRYSRTHGAIEQPTQHLDVAGLMKTVVVFEVASGLRFPADDIARMDRNQIA